MKYTQYSIRGSQNPLRIAGVCLDLNVMHVMERKGLGVVEVTIPPGKMNLVASGGLRGSKQEGRRRPVINYPQHT